MYQNKLYYEDNYINYIKQNSKQNSKNLAVIFFTGLNSNINSTKAKFLSEICLELDLEYIRFDYFGHGQSSGNFASGTIKLWLNNCALVIEKLTDKNILIVGSSLGGWLMMHMALMFKEKVKALIGIAPAIDFTEDLIWNKLSQLEQRQMQSKGSLRIRNGNCDDGYDISFNLIENARDYLFDNNLIDLDIPIRLIHGMEDNDVPYRNSIKLAKQLKSNEILVEFVKDAAHNLNRQQDLQIIKKHFHEIINII